jgi:repressor LexA
MKLTARQQEILNYIREFRRQAGCSPSIPELQRAFGFRSPNAVASHLAALETKGAIRRAERGSRQIEIPGEAHPTSPIPLLGAIPAGTPQQHEPLPPADCLHVDLEALGFRPQRGCYALRVRGDSMIGAAILDGDIVVIQPSPSPKAGQIVAALIDGESTLKRLVSVRGRWYLKAENAAYPELIPRSDLVIQGVVQLVIRQLKA